ncbi:MAG: flagellar export protein FliJ [Desulfobacterales bacterium]|nr:MAG: flagellar export protein FliJ [Desulfobacterales bacterium]
MNHRRHEEEIRQKELAVAKKKMVEEQAALRTQKRAHRKWMEALQHKQQEGHRPWEIILFFDYLNRLNQELDECKQRLLAAEKDFTQRRRQLVEAVKRRKTLEKLKEKEEQRHQRKALKDERNFHDEVATSRHSRPTA